MSAAQQSVAARAGLWARALRLPFASASALPFLLGAAAATPAADAAYAVPLGLVAVVAAHLCANLANDVADTDSGADAQDPVARGFFGGSKVICAGLLARSAVRTAAWLLGGASIAALLTLAFLRHSCLPLGAAAFALALALAYSLPPLKLAYRGWGEPTVGLLFGPVAVSAGYYCCGGVAFSPTALRLGVVAGLLTMAILLANEVPDAADDARVGKRTWVVRLGADRGWLLFVGTVAGAFGVLASVGVRGGWTHGTTFALVAGLAPAIGAAVRLRVAPHDKLRLRGASARAILMQAVVLLVLTLERWL